MLNSTGLCNVSVEDLLEKSKCLNKNISLYIRGFLRFTNFSKYTTITLPAFNLNNKKYARHTF